MSLTMVLFYPLTLFVENIAIRFNDGQYEKQCHAGHMAWQKKAGPLYLFILAMVVTGCTGPIPAFDPKTRIFVTQGAEDAVFIAPALDATARQFLGPGRSRKTGSGLADGATSSPQQTRSAVLIRPDMLAPGSDTPYRLDQSNARTVGLRVEQPLRGGVTATGRLSIGQGKTVYALPDGLGVLTDPTTIRFDTDFAQIEAGLAWHTPLTDRVSAEAEVALGVRETRTETHVTSALLDVQNTSSQTSPYFVLRNGFDLSLGTGNGSKAQLGAEARIFPGESVTLHQTLSFTF